MARYSVQPSGRPEACDFLTQYTAFFAVAYVFVLMEIHSRRIIHVNVTTNPLGNAEMEFSRTTAAEVW